MSQSTGRHPFSPFLNIYVFPTGRRELVFRQLGERLPNTTLADLAPLAEQGLQHERQARQLALSRLRQVRQAGPALGFVEERKRGPVRARPLSPLEGQCRARPICLPDLALASWPPRHQLIEVGAQ